MREKQPVKAIFVRIKERSGGKSYIDKLEHALADLPDYLADEFPDDEGVFEITAVEMTEEEYERLLETGPEFDGF